MHVEIDYNKLAPEAKKLTALQDLIDYIGIEKYRAIRQTVRKVPNTEDNRRSVEMQFALLAGVQGYPVAVFLDLNLGRDYPVVV